LQVCNYSIIQKTTFTDSSARVQSKAQNNERKEKEKVNKYEERKKNKQRELLHARKTIVYLYV
jgi:hypothetical protein